MSKLSSIRPFMAALLVALMLVLPLSHAAAEQRQQYPPFAPYVPQEEQEEGRSTAAKWFGAALFVGLLYCAWTGCVGSGNNGSTEQSRPSAEEIYRRKEGQTSTRTQPGTSTHLDYPPCYWGTVKDGTCVR